MKAARAPLFVAALLMAASAYADPVPAASTTPAPAAGTILAPPSSTSAAVLMARAFRPKPQTCESQSPGMDPVLMPALRDQPNCMLSPFARDKWGRCPAFPPAPVLQLDHALPPNQQPSFIVGDQIEAAENGASLISGNVQLDQGDRRVTSQKMTYDSDTGIALVNEGVGYASPRMMLTSPSGVYDTGKGSGSFKDADFLMPQRNGHGTAALFNSVDDAHSQLVGATYTTCPPGNVDWMLSAPGMNFDTSTNTGEAYDVTIHFLGMPIFWTPYLNFPLTDDRKSGFLGGNFSFDVINGVELNAPYYLNLADNYDVTLFPRIITKRGVDMGAEARWLTQYNQGMIYGDYLPHDQVADRERSQLAFKNDTDINEFNNVSALYNWVSDYNYFHELGSQLSTNSTVNLPRHLRYTYDDEADWLFMSQFEDFQVLNPRLAPERYTYRRLPQVVLDWGNNQDISGPQYHLYGEAVRFQRELRIGAWRTDLKPSMSLPISGAAAYFTPTVAWRVTDYDLTNDTFTPFRQPTITVGDRHLSRSLPIFDIDTGLFFDREGESYTQTLEPRLYYLRVPYRDQSQIPVFDALQPEFGYLQLFSDNRFYGADRQGDANQVSYALTTRFLDSLTGAQVLQADVGQIRYFSDRRVQLRPDTPPQTALFSDVVGDVLYDFNEMWSASYNQLWNPATRQTDLAAVLLQYHPGYHQVINIGYQFRRPNLKQTDFSFAWPLAGAWSWVGRWTYDVVNHINLEELWGFEYDNCCWNFQIVHRHFLMPNQSYDNVFFFQLQLKGLGTAGRHLDDLLRRGILGYSDNDFDQPLQPEELPGTQ
ncbi:MAG TPA: LPS assembly protein LptD [Gammaproteobacteria bacterium]|nr:LPS assembly protein LptD [Gammaproteobacteria bacterium]